MSHAKIELLMISVQGDSKTIRTAMEKFSEFVQTKFADDRLGEMESDLKQIQEKQQHLIRRPRNKKRSIECSD